MKIKTSITLSEEVLRAVDGRLADHKNRSELIETAVTLYLARLARAEQEATDLHILNRRVDRLNKEAADVLSYQVDL